MSKSKAFQTSEVAMGEVKPASEITNKKGYAERWQHSVRAVDKWISQGLPHLKIGKRRVRIIIPEADAWMRERFGTQRRGPTRPTHETSKLL
jgi:hypothetical protein